MSIIDKVAPMKKDGQKKTLRNDSMGKLSLKLKIVTSYLKNLK